MVVVKPSQLDYLQHVPDRNPFRVIKLKRAPILDEIAARLADVGKLHVARHFQDCTRRRRGQAHLPGVGEFQDLVKDIGVALNGDLALGALFCG